MTQRLKGFGVIYYGRRWGLRLGRVQTGGERQGGNYSASQMCSRGSGGGVW